MTSEEKNSVIDQMIEAYNSHDLEKFLGFFHQELKSTRLNTNEVVASNLDDFRKAFEVAFKDNPKLHCKVRSRMTLGVSIVVEEFTTGAARSPSGLLQARVYELKDGLIHRIWSAN